MNALNHPVVLLVNPSGNDVLATTARATAVALARATLGRNQRLLILADSGTLLQVAFAAADYRAPAQVELGEATPAPLVILTILQGENAEDGLLFPFDNETNEHSEPANLLDTLFALRIIDTSIYTKFDELSQESASDIFKQWKPQAIVAIGIGRGIEAVLSSAVAYRSEHTDVRLFYADTDITRQNSYWEETGWRPLDSLLTDAERDAPVTLGGLPIEDEALSVLATQAANEAVLALATERVVGEDIPPEAPFRHK